MKRIRKPASPRPVTAQQLARVTGGGLVVIGLTVKQTTTTDDIGDGRDY